MFTGGDGGGDGNQPTLQQILERMRKLEQDLAVERALRQMGNPGGTTVPGQGTSAPPVVPGRAARDASAISGIRADSVKAFKFDGTDYELWSIIMVRALISAGLWEVVQNGWVPPAAVSGSATDGADGQDGDGTNGDGTNGGDGGDTGPDAEWIAMNNDAELLILGAVSRGQMTSIGGCSSAKEMWDKLKRNYSERSRANLMRAERDYLNCAMRRGQSMDDYIRIFESHCTRLRSLGYELEEDSQVNRLLEGLTADYDIIRTTLQDRDTLSYEQATSRLLANARGRPRGAPFHSYRPRANEAGAEENQEDNASANAVNSKDKKKKTGKCYICADPGHFSDTCPYKTRNKGDKICQEGVPGECLLGHYQDGGNCGDTNSRRCHSGVSRRAICPRAAQESVISFICHSKRN